MDKLYDIKMLKDAPPVDSGICKPAGYYTDFVFKWNNTFRGSAKIKINYPKSIRKKFHSPKRRLSAFFNQVICKISGVK